ncbi:hypothetical protein ANCCAN_00332 [Ancylostoma caninum]|uniref:Methyltransferase domain protein n=1 Tax=Ancylostoma caninum TaxID=29170 RepID=A0A368H9I9_ANCCA|nr:hypothetical protein ANCCAN_00332 [Ancylostoma caninum]
MRFSIARPVLAVIKSIRQKKNCRIRFFLGACIVCSLLVYIIFFVLLTDDWIIDDQYVNAVDESVLKKRVDFREVAIDRRCSKRTSRCYSVFDRKISEGGRNFEEIVERHLLIDGYSDDSDTVVRLVPPGGESFDRSDTRIWNVDHSDIRSQYVGGMLVAPFLVSSLTLDSPDIGKSVLEIGLGGGSFDMNLHKWKPNVNISVIELDSTVADIAKKWFGVEEEKNRHTIVQDGLDYLEQALKQGVTFDVIVLDACDEAIRAPCPAEVFRSAKVIRNFKKALKSSGCLIVNILSNDNPEAKSSSAEIVQLYSSIFPSCIRMRMTKEINIILACVPYSIADVRQQISFYNNRLKSVISHLKLDRILDNVVVI